VRECLSGIPLGSRIAVAFSGGLDSSVLLALAAKCVIGHDLALSAIHVHHGLSAHADAWADFCRDVCAGLGVPLETVRVSVPHGAAEGIEAAARSLRYQAFAAHASDYILLAHHANDQAETLLFNLMRGTGVRGAAGIPAVGGRSGRYLRPLLSLARAELEACAQALALRWIDDESNTDTRYSRNFIRHEVLPVLEARFPAAVDNLARATEYFSEAQEMLDEMARADLASCQDFPVPAYLLAGLSAARARNVLRYLLAQHGLQAPGSKRLEEVLRQFIEAAPDRHPSLELPMYRLFRRRGLVMLESR
jgi:tRNA(Ile)-lysidine synthase